MQTCPRCGKPNDASASACASCGVIMSKVRPRAAAAGPAPVPAPRSVTEPDSTPPSSFAAGLKVLLATGAAGAAIFFLSRLPENQKRPEAALPELRAQPSSNSIPAFAVPATGATDSANALSREDLSYLNTLASRLQAAPGSGPSDTDLDRVESLFASHGGNSELKSFLTEIYLRRAGADLQAGLFARTDLSLARLKAIDDQQSQIYEVEAYSKAAQHDWPGAEGAARRHAATAGETSLGVAVTLATALQQQGRGAEALAILNRPLFQSCPGVSPADGAACAAARQMRTVLAQSAEPAPAEERPRAALQVDASKNLIQSDRFDVRFDGDSQQGVARDVLFVLDRAYVRLAGIYYDRPARKIPIVLHSSQDYFTKTGAPWWSGGAYSSHDGAIQIPIRGLPSTLPREMEDVLVHELSHAFVDEMSGGFAGRDLQEGLAQYMEGKRIEQELGLAELKRLANSADRTVMNFYMLSLAVSEQLVQSRGQGMVNQALKAMKETGSEDEGFKKAFGQPGAALKRDILATFWRRYS